MVVVIYVVVEVVMLWWSMWCGVVGLGMVLCDCCGRLV